MCLQQVLVKHQLIEPSLSDQVKAFLAANQTASGNEQPAFLTHTAPKPKRWVFGFHLRSSSVQQPWSLDAQQLVDA